ncbi:MAG: hypothetical protein RL376_93, partial [Verrucomicrobiota bacterium]
MEIEIKASLIALLEAIKVSNAA